MPDYVGGPAPYHADAPGSGRARKECDFGNDDIFALDAGLDELHGVAFDKGCYVGQELTARMKHRGTAKKRILAVRADRALPPPGEKLMAGDLEIGGIISTYGSDGFALMRLDRLEQAKASLTAASIPLTVMIPPWLNA